MADEDDLWELRDRFDAADIWCSEVVDHGFIRSIYTFDPNNIAIEFSAPVPGVDVRKTPVMADTDPCREARKGPEPQAGVWPKVTHPTPDNERERYEGEGSRILAMLKEKRTRLEIKKRLRTISGALFILCLMKRYASCFRASRFHSETISLTSSY